MNRLMTTRFKQGLVCLAVLPVAAMAQFEGKTCLPIPASTMTIPAPGSGTVSVGDLTKFGLPAQLCSTTSFTGSNIVFDYTTTLATQYANARFPSSCAGIEYMLNGGPVYSAVTGNGNFAFNMSNPTAAITGTMQAVAFSLTENLTLTAAGNSFVINTGLLSFNTSVTINADQSIDIRICTPPGGIPANVNGASFNIPSSVWQCLAAPTEIQPNVRVTYVDGC